jgi:hypothetical protein
MKWAWWEYVLAVVIGVVVVLTVLAAIAEVEFRRDCNARGGFAVKFQCVLLDGATVKGSAQ